MLVTNYRFQRRLIMSTHIHKFSSNINYIPYIIYITYPYALHTHTEIALGKSGVCEYIYNLYYMHFVVKQ